MMQNADYYDDEMNLPRFGQEGKQNSTKRKLNFFSFSCRSKPIEVETGQQISHSDGINQSLLAQDPRCQRHI